MFGGRLRHVFGFTLLVRPYSVPQKSLKRHLICRLAMHFKELPPKLPDPFASIPFLVEQLGNLEACIRLRSITLDRRSKLSTETLPIC